MEWEWFRRRPDGPPTATAKLAYVLLDKLIQIIPDLGGYIEYSNSNDIGDVIINFKPLDKALLCDNRNTIRLLTFIRQGTIFRYTSLRPAFAEFNNYTFERFEFENLGNAYYALIQIRHDQMPFVVIKTLKRCDSNSAAVAMKTMLDCFARAQKVHRVREFLCKHLVYKPSSPYMRRLATTFT